MTHTGGCWLLLTCGLLSLRMYRGYSLSANTSDVTIENNLSRVITAVSHALTSSTSRALTVSPYTSSCCLATVPLSLSNCTAVTLQLYRCYLATVPLSLSNCAAVA